MAAWTLTIPEIRSANVREELPRTATDDPTPMGHPQDQIFLAKLCVKTLMDGGALRFGDGDYCSVELTGNSAVDADEVTIAITRVDPPEDAV